MPPPRRIRKTSRRVILAERVARALITVGGVGTILTVSLIFFFLVWVVAPLFTGATVEAGGEVALERGEPRAVLVDEYRVLSTVVYADGAYEVVRLDTGSAIDEGRLFEAAPTAAAFGVGAEECVFGFADGTIQRVTWGFGASFPEEDEVPEELDSLAQDEVAELDGGLVQRTPEGTYRLQRFAVESVAPVPAEEASPVRDIDLVIDEGSQIVCVLSAGGELSYYELFERENLFTGKTTLSSSEYSIDYSAPPGKGPPDHMRLLGRGDNILLFWSDGTLVRIDCRRPEEAQVAAILDLVPEPERRLTAVDFLLGKSTLLVGDSQGDVGAWFLTKPDDAGTVDGALLKEAHRVPGDGAPVTAFGPSSRSRLLSIGYGDGALRLEHLTSGKHLGSVEVEGGGAITSIGFAPKEDGLAVASRGRLHTWALDPRHPEASFRALFSPVWYEGYEGPEHVWQSSSGTDEFEEKFGMVPLVYGTLKATFYSMLFGAPLAILAAIYSSEFLDRRLRTPVKSTIEMMASLPSVVLGFLAALILAPFVQAVLPATLALLLLWPLTLLLGAYLWQMIPRATSLRLGGAPRLLCMALTIPVAVAAAAGLGPLLEDVLFAGNTELWLDGQVGDAVGGWFLLLLPLAGLVAALASSRLVNPRLRHAAEGWSAGAYARADFAKFALLIAGAVGLSFGAALALNALGVDPRGGVVDTYVPRNALVVGFIMGFAIVPIIYTLAEDALSSVPEHLRLASLGCGATPWQTAVRVIVPTAMSGLFSALMIGLGRAVGETMIVLMATGNTPVMEMNVFNGFRTLSANIAVELPEAVQNSTHYRTLFLAALVLFAITFLVNTAAELVRQHFRKKAVQL